ncbi:3429_t:CDS:2 [Entrophospora sp. SA101]|nr:3429_t:CDS:2 [Entrophospora sp. SA101]
MDTLASMNNTDSKQLDIKTIPPGDLKDPEPEEVVKRGKITKKLLKGIEPVACKPLTDEIMENVEKAKIANFTLSREYNNRSVQIKSINELIPWMAPEKLKDPDNYPYNIKCEIFR